MAKLPPELWIIILDMVIEEGIVRMDQYDHNTFPYDHFFLFPGRDHRFYASYHRLRLVSRSFNALLGIRPYNDLRTSLFPFQASIRALRIPAFDGPHEPTFQQLLADTSRCERLVCLEVSCYISALPNLSDIFHAGDGPAFPNIQRLGLSLLGNQLSHVKLSFWTRLHRQFPNLVTLSIGVDNGYIYLTDDTVVTFEALEILRLVGDIGYTDCRFPRLRHASLGSCSDNELETLKHSLQPESLLVRSFDLGVSINLGSFSKLHVLSVSQARLYAVVPLDPDHPLEHLWLYLVNMRVIGCGRRGFMADVCYRVRQLFTSGTEADSVSPTISSSHSSPPFRHNQGIVVHCPLACRARMTTVTEQIRKANDLRRSVSR